MEQIYQSLYESSHSQEPYDARDLWLLNIAQTSITRNNHKDLKQKINPKDSVHGGSGH
jgi:hypothetical protein